MSKFSDCIEKAAKELSGLTVDEIESYVNETLINAKNSGLSGIAAIRAAQQKTYDDLLLSIGSDEERAKNSVIKYNRINKKIIDKSNGVIDFIVRRDNNLSDNVESSQKSIRNKLLNAMFNKLSNDEVLYLKDVKNQDNIVNAIDSGYGSAIDLKIAKIITDDYIVVRNRISVLSDYMPMEYIQSDRYLKAIHDPAKLINPDSFIDRISSSIKSISNKINGISNYNKNAADDWLKYIKPLLNIEETFKNTDAISDGIIADDKVDSILKEIYDNIVTGKSDIFQKTGILKDIQAISKRRRMFFHWKDARAFHDYNKRYGTGNLFSAILRDIQGSSRKIGVADILGAAPEQVIASLTKDQLKYGKKLSAIGSQNIKYAYDEVSGVHGSVVSPKIANFFGTIRSLTSMARLGSLILTSLTDVSIASSYANRFGITYADAFKNQIHGIVTQFSSREQKYLGKMMNLHMNHHMGYIGKFVDTHDMGTLTAKFTERFYKLTGMEAWDGGNTFALMNTVSMSLYNNVNKKFTQLNDELRSQLENFNINSYEWDAIRRHANNDEKLITLDSVDEISNNELKKIRDSYGDNDITLSDIKNRLYRKLFSFYDVAGSNAILSPGAFERAIMYRGTRRGELQGELMRIIMQFKGFPLTFINKSLIGGWKNAGTGSIKKTLFLTKLFALSLPLAYMSVYFHNLSNGLSTPNIMDMTESEKYQMMLAPFGIFSMGLDPKEQNPQIVANLLFGNPSTHLLGALTSSIFALPEANTKKGQDNIKKNLATAAEYMLPISTIPFANPYIKEALGKKQYKDKNQKILFGG